MAGTGSCPTILFGSPLQERHAREPCRIGGGGEVTLAGLFVDYVDHLEHHLRKMLGRWEGGAQ